MKPIVASFLTLVVGATAILFSALTFAEDDKSAEQPAIGSEAKPPAIRSNVPVSYGPPQTILTDKGPISFGMIVSAEVVSWSAPDAKDILVARLWEGVYLYPSQDLQSIGQPLQLCDTLGRIPLMVRTAGGLPAETSTVIGADRSGNLFYLKKVGTPPNLRLEAAEPVRDSSTHLPFNVPFNNPHYRLEDFNYLFPVVYPSRRDEPPGLIVGDWAGRLWWMRCDRAIDGLPSFKGESYRKSDGRSFARPALQAVDEGG